MVKSAQTTGVFKS